MLTSEYRVSEPKTEAEFEKYYQLRWEVLRKPWNQPIGSEKDDLEAVSHHAMITDLSNNVIAVSRLQVNDNKIGQIRFMAVAPPYQGAGLGKTLLHYQEEKARTMGLNKIILDARDNALEFYIKEGYKTTATGHLLYDSIQHYRMEKNLAEL